MLPPERMAEPVLVTLRESLSLVSTRNTSTVLLLLALACAPALALALASTDALALADCPDLDAEALALALAPACADASALAPAWFSVVAYRPRRAVVSLKVRDSMFCAASNCTFLAFRSTLPAALSSEPCKVTVFLALMVTLPPKFKAEPTLR